MEISDQEMAVMLNGCFPAPPPPEEANMLICGRCGVVVPNTPPEQKLMPAGLLTPTETHAAFHVIVERSWGHEPKSRIILPNGV